MKHTEFQSSDCNHWVYKYMICEGSKKKYHHAVCLARFAFDTYAFQFCAEEARKYPSSTFTVVIQPIG